MTTSTHLSDGQQMDPLLDAGARKPSAMLPTCTRGAGPRAAVDRAGGVAGAGIQRSGQLTIELRGLRARLETHALQQQVSMAALMRRALVLMLGDKSTDGAELACAKPEAGKVAKLTLSMSSGHALLLASRARAADVSRGRYVSTLLDDMPAPPLPADHAVAVMALRASTDMVAAMSADLNAFLRLLRLGPGDQLQNYRAGLMSLADDMRAHLVTASTLIAELTPARAKR